MYKAFCAFFLFACIASAEPILTKVSYVRIFEPQFEIIPDRKKEFTELRLKTINLFPLKK
jgi:hypothetical protein